MTTDAASLVARNREAAEKLRCPGQPKCMGDTRAWGPCGHRNDVADLLDANAAELERRALPVAAAALIVRARAAAKDWADWAQMRFDEDITPEQGEANGALIEALADELEGVEALMVELAEQGEGRRVENDALRAALAAWDLPMVELKAAALRADRKAVERVAENGYLVRADFVHVLQRVAMCAAARGDGT